MIEYAGEQIFRGSTEAVKLRMKMSGRQVRYTRMCNSKINVSTEIRKLQVAFRLALDIRNVQLLRRGLKEIRRRNGRYCYGQNELVMVYFFMVNNYFTLID